MGFDERMPLSSQLTYLLHVEDMKQLYRCALANVQRARRQAVNAGYRVEKSLYLSELFALIEEVLDVRLVVEKFVPRASHPRLFVPDMVGARSILGRIPKVDVRGGIGSMLSQLREKR